MAAKYNIADEYDSHDDVITTSPEWVIAVIRYAHPLTFSRDKLIQAQGSIFDSNVSFNPDNSILSQTIPILIIEDIQHMTITAHKGNHCPQLTAVLGASGVNYLAEILPGDWVMAWIVNGPEKKHEIIKSIRAKLPANGFNDGFKFLGRVQDIRKTLMQTPEGIRTMQYNLCSTGFSELDSEIFYDPHLAMKDASIGQYLARLNIQIGQIFEHSAKEAQKGKGGIDSNLAIPTLIRVLIGEGVPNDFATRGGLNLAEGLINTEEAPYAYQVPEEVGQLLGVQRKTKATGAYAYADILDLVQGLQKYNETRFPALFHPVGVGSGPTENRHFTKHPLKGTFLPLPTDFSGKSVWSLLNEYLNPAVNEMYTAIKYTPSGKIMPTLVVRQLPFNSPIVTNKLGNSVTSFLEVPRWVASASCVRSMDVGRSDSTRFNFVHVYGQSSAPGLSITEQIVRNPPIRDDQDSKRHGMRPYMQTVSCSLNDTVAGPREWMTIISDIVMGQQLTLTGCVALVGVQAPIPVGDNFEFDGVVYHIESVTHTCTISADGHKSFVTQLQLTHGIRSDLPAAIARIPESKTIAVLTPKHNKSPRLEAVKVMLSKAKTEKQRDAIYNWYGGKELVEKAITNDGRAVELVTVVGDRQQNPDLYMYSGIDSRDITGHDPAITSEEE